MLVQEPFPPLSARGPQARAGGDSAVGGALCPDESLRATQGHRGIKPLLQRHTESVGRSSVLRSRSSGFTLLELLAVIGIIAILTGIVIGVGQSAAEKGKIARARAELAVLASALESYKAIRGDYPRTSDSARLLQALIGRRGPEYDAVTGRSLLDIARFSASADPFTTESAVLLDPWEQPYRYAYKALPGWTNPSFVLASAGPDQTGTATLLSGGFPDVAAPGNADNIYAGQ